MNIVALSVLAVGMSMDAFAASVAKGAQQKTTIPIAVKTGLIFGVSEAITPIVGYFLGVWSHDLVKDYDHWVSFALLSGLGAYFIYEAFFERQDSTPSHWAKTWATAFATSIDALIIGISLAFMGANIWLSALMIGATSTTMASFGVLIGARIGDKIGNKAQIFGGIMLMVIGTFILCTHLLEK